MIDIESTLLDNFVIFVSPDAEFVNITRAQLEKTLSKHSALVVRNINRRVTHVVSTVDDPGNTIDLAHENGIKLICAEYFEKCIESSSILEEERYYLDDDDIAEAKRERSNKKMSRESVLKSPTRVLMKKRKEL